VLLPASHPATPGPALATSYVVHRVEDAFANDGQVMRQTRSLDAPSSGGAAFYLPVQVTLSIGGSGLHTTLTSFDIQWLPPTAANRARASVTVPCGYQQISWPSGKPASGQPSSACG